jgi:hypothetical protein
MSQLSHPSPPSPLEVAEAERYASAWKDLRRRNWAAWVAGGLMVIAVVGSPFLRASVDAIGDPWYFGEPSCLHKSLSFIA